MQPNRSETVTFMTQEESKSPKIADGDALFAAKPRYLDATTVNFFEDLLSSHLVLPVDARGTLNVAKNVNLMKELNRFITDLEHQQVSQGQFEQLTDWLYELSSAKVKEYKLLQEYWKFVYRVACNLAQPLSSEVEEGRVHKEVNATCIRMWRVK